MKTVLILAAVFSASVQAQVQWPEELDVDLNYRNSAAMIRQGPWDLRLGAGVEREPTYQGSDRSQTELDPFVVAAYRANWGNVFLSGEGLGYSRLFSDRFGISLQLEAEDTREIDDDPRLAGLGDQDEELELEINGSYFLGPLTLGSSVALATGDKGFVWFAGASYTWRLANNRLFATLSADLSGSNSDNQNTDFGITPAQSLSSGFAEYEADGGLKSFGLGLRAEYQLNQNWYLYGALEAERLLGDVADSPLTLDDTNAELSLGFFYRF